MAKNKNVHEAAEALALELAEWGQYPEDTGWSFRTVNGRLTAARYDEQVGEITAVYSVDLADIPFTKNKEA